MVSNLSNITVDLTTDYNKHLIELAISIFDEYLRKDAPNKIDIDEDILAQLYDKFGCNQTQQDNPLVQKFSIRDIEGWDTNIVNMKEIERNVDKFLFYKLYEAILEHL